MILECVPVTLNDGCPGSASSTNLAYLLQEDCPLDPDYCNHQA